jgi:hypothetical protein
MKSAVAMVLFANLFAPISLNATSQRQPVKPAKPEVTSDPLDALNKAEIAFQNAEYPRTQELVKSIQNQNPQLDASQSIRLYLLQARLEFAARNMNGAKPFLEKILAINPKFELDPLSDPPEAITLLKELKGPTHSSSSQSTPTANTSSSEEMQDRSSLLRKRAGFWGGLLPFGLGHFETGDYKGGIAFLVLDSTSLYVSPFFRGKEKWSPDRTQRYRNSTFPNRASELIFAGSWGYEILDVMPALMARDNMRANWARHWLSFFPLGVGQLKNGHYAKAVGFGVTQSALLFYAMTTGNSEQRETATTVLIGTLLYGGFDGWLHHRWINFEPKTVERRGWTILPTIAHQDEQIAPAALIELRW